jgi:methanogenic corrinoid protein MtbC1
METVDLFKEYLVHLFGGRRNQARELIFAAHDRGYGADKLLNNVIWPAMEQIDNLYREDHINRVVEHMAVRINRTIADQLHAVLNRKPKDGRRLTVLCGECESSELGAQICSDLFEAEGWSVWFVGSSVPNDEVLAFLGQITPDMLLIFGSMPGEMPSVRKLIALIREVGICPDMQVMVCGGLYNRAEDLAEEIKADLFSHDAREALRLSEDHPQRIDRDDKPEPGRRRKRKRPAQKARIQQLREELGITHPQDSGAPDDDQPESGDEEVQTEAAETRDARQPEPVDAET